MPDPPFHLVASTYLLSSTHWIPKGQSSLVSMIDSPTGSVKWCRISYRVSGWNGHPTRGRTSELGPGIAAGRPLPSCFYAMIGLEERHMERETFGLPKLALPPEPPTTPEELERRRKVGEQIRKLRDK